VALSMATSVTHKSICEATFLIEQPADVLVLIWWWRQTWRPDCPKWRHDDSFYHGPPSLDAIYGLLFHQFGWLIEV
jgi:hypothetical protein